MSTEGKLPKLDERYTVNEFNCGCLIRSEFTNGLGCKWIIYCREHKAAPELVEALEAADVHLSELREAWQRGAIAEYDGQGGTRSNRNADVHKLIRTALTAAGKVK